MITTTTEIDCAQTESTTEAPIATVAIDALDSVSGGWCGPYAVAPRPCAAAYNPCAVAHNPCAVGQNPYAVARYAAHLERRAEWVGQRAQRMAYRWGY